MLHSDAATRLQKRDSKCAFSTCQLRLLANASFASRLPVQVSAGSYSSRACGLKDARCETSPQDEKFQSRRDRELDSAWRDKPHHPARMGDRHTSLVENAQTVRRASGQFVPTIRDPARITAEKRDTTLAPRTPASLQVRRFQHAGVSARNRVAVRYQRCPEACSDPLSASIVETRRGPVREVLRHPMAWSGIERQSRD